jgi:hypothetical protein
MKNALILGVILRVSRALAADADPTVEILSKEGDRAVVRIVRDPGVNPGDRYRLERAQKWTGLSRYYLRVRPVFGVVVTGTDVGDPHHVGGVVADFGVEANTRSGFRIGIDIAPIAMLSNVLVPSVSARIHLGYANEFVGVGLAVGGDLSFLYPQAGPVVRVGRFTGSYALLRLAWSVHPARLAPVDGSLEVVVRVSPRWRLQLDAGGAYGALLGVYALAGVQALALGNGGRGTVALSGGIGVSWAQYTLGPALSLGIEQRF